MLASAIRVIVCGGIGLGFGVALTFLGLIATGAGHGTYVILGLASAPIGLTQNIMMAILGGPLCWTFIGLLLGLKRWYLRSIFVPGMFVHYASCFIILNPPSKFADWSYVPRVGVLFWIAIAFYCAGQLAAWYFFVATFLSKGDVARGTRGEIGKLEN